jgi:copper homeostasis protein CutC
VADKARRARDADRRGHRPRPDQCGRAATALEGADTIAALVRQAGDRIVVLAGGGVRAHNVRDLIARTGVREVHSRFVGATAMGLLVDAVGILGRVL